jgi:hypothetical protein
MRSILEKIQKEWIVIIEKAKKLKAENINNNNIDDDDDSVLMIIHYLLL